MLHLIWYERIIESRRAKLYSNCDANFHKITLEEERLKEKLNPQVPPAASCAGAPRAA
jgi:hypothetical protein